MCIHWIYRVKIKWNAKRKQITNDSYLSKTINFWKWFNTKFYSSMRQCIFISSFNKIFPFSLLLLSLLCSQKLKIENSTGIHIHTYGTYHFSYKQMVLWMMRCILWHSLWFFFSLYLDIFTLKLSSHPIQDERQACKSYIEWKNKMEKRSRWFVCNDHHVRMGQRKSGELKIKIL